MKARCKAVGIPIAAIILCLMALGGCSQKEPPLEEVNYRLKWLFNVSVVGDLWAIEYGSFAKNGLKVNLKPGGPEKDAIKELELGHALRQGGVREPEVELILAFGDAAVDVAKAAVRGDLGRQPLGGGFEGGHVIVD